MGITDYKKRLASVYTPKALYDPEALKKEIDELAKKVGQEKLGRAVKAAAAVYQENSILTIRALIELEDRYGQVAVSEAVQIVSQKSPENPKRSAGYLIETIKKIQVLV